MEVVKVSLDAEELRQIGQMPCAEAALLVCRPYLRRVRPGVTFVAPSKNADLRVQVPGELDFDIEVKGTEKTGVAWGQLKVSSQQSHDLLVGGMLLYRVTGIRSNPVTIFILRRGIDFEMSPEPRWSVHTPRKT